MDLSVGEEATFSVAAYDRRGRTVRGASVTWKSSNSSVVEVNSSSGRVIGRSGGSATITASAGWASATASAEVTSGS